MKATDTKHTTTAAKTSTPQPAQAFFRQAEGSFFSNATAEPAFFNIQPKLSVGEPGDKFEKEADSMADKVVQQLSESPVTAPPPAATIASAGSGALSSAGPGAKATGPGAKATGSATSSFTGLSTSSSADSAAPSPVKATAPAPSVQAKCAECEKEEKLQKEEDDAGPQKIHRKCAACENEERLQRQSADSGAATGLTGVAKSLQNFRGQGKALPAKVKAQMEQQFGKDFGGVRVHTDHEATRLNRKLRAHAFTHGKDIYFNEGKYNPDSKDGMHLLAHELTHTVQQGQAPEKPVIQRVSWGDFVDAVEDTASDVGGAVSDAASTVADKASDAAGAVADAAGRVADTAGAVAGKVADTAGAVADKVADTAGAVADKAGELASDVADAAGDLVSAGVEWLESAAGAALKRLAKALGVEVSVTAAGLVISIPKHCPGGAFHHTFTLDPIKGSKMIPIVGLPIGPLVLTGSIGVTGSITPEIQIQLGPVCLNGVTILINPLTNNYSIDGSVSLTTAASLGGLATGGVRGSVDLKGVIPIGGVPVPIDVPVAGAEGGIFGVARGILAQTFTLGGGLGYSGGIVTFNQGASLDTGMAADLFLGAYAQLDVLGKNLCRIYWQPYEWHGGLATRLGVSASLSFGGGGFPVGFTVSPTVAPIPFDNFPLAISREGVTHDDCPIIDKLCDIVKALNMLPSQNGGVWDWKGTGRRGFYGPGPRLPGPREVYLRDPAITSGSTCRGACGPSCETCQHHPTYRYTDPKTGEVWEYTNFEDCNSNDGCREHDAAYDWAADAKGETGKYALLMPWHMLANLECACNNLAGNCIAWIFGAPPYDQKMYFAQDAHKVSGVGPHGGGGGGKGGGGGSGGGGVTPSSEEEDLKKCDRHELPEKFCEDLQNKVIERFGNKERNINIDPDSSDPKKGVNEGRTREDDAPILTSFRKMYNRLDSWVIFMHHRHPELFPEFDGKFHVDAERTRMLTHIKDETKKYKAQFRDLKNQETDSMKKAFTDNILKETETEIIKLNRDIATWFKEKTKSDEDIDTIIEDINTQATEMWREDWRAAILAVNRILSVLWPPAKTHIIGFVDDLRKKHPDDDLSGNVEDIDYIGSLAMGYKGAPKQFIRFNPEKFDVDANLEAPPLEKFAVNILGKTPDRGRIFAIKDGTGITPLIDFCKDADKQLSGVHGYDTSDPMDVAINAHDTPAQTISIKGTERIYKGRKTMDPKDYTQMIQELQAAGLMQATGQLKGELTPEEGVTLDGILKKHGL